MLNVIVKVDPTGSPLTAALNTSSVYKLRDFYVAAAEPALEPPHPPAGGGPHDPQGPHVTAGQFFYRPYSITSHTCTILFSARWNQSLA